MKVGWNYGNLEKSIDSVKENPSAQIIYVECRTKYGCEGLSIPETKALIANLEAMIQAVEK